MKQQKVKPDMTDQDSPELTDAWFKKAKKFDELPKSLQAKLRKVRGAQKAPTKKLVSIRLSPEVVDHFKATGPGWQSKIDQTLKRAIR